MKIIVKTLCAAAMAMSLIPVSAEETDTDDDGIVDGKAI